MYAAGIAGNWVWCQNGSLPATCVFDDTARSTVDWFLDELGANHVSHWPVQPQNRVLVYMARTLNAAGFKNLITLYKSTTWELKSSLGSQGGGKVA